MNIGIYAILTVFVLSVLSLQEVYAGNERLEYAVVNFDNKTFNLYFNTTPTFDSIDLSINGMNFSTYTIDKIVQNVINLDSDQLEQFRNIECPTIHVKHDLTGINYITPLWINFPTNEWIPPKPGVDVECELTYKITGEFVLHMNEYIIDGLEVWSDINPGLNFKEIKTGVPNINIKKVINSSPGSSGIACTGCLYTFDINNKDRNNKGGMIDLNYNLDFLPHTVVYIISHEFGHVVGLQHDENHENLMYSGGGNFQIPYDSLGYNIPSKIKWYDFENLISTIHVIITSNDILNYDIILGALIAGVIGFIVQKINSNSEKRDILKNIRECLDYELKTIIDMLNKKTETLEPFCKDCNNPEKTSIAETMGIHVAFDSGYQDIKIPLLNAIYSNNYVFNLSQNELKNIQNIQIYVDDHNNSAQTLYKTIQQLVNDQMKTNHMINNNQIPDNKSEHKVENIWGIQRIFLCGYKELNEDLVKKLKNLKDEIKEND